MDQFHVLSTPLEGPFPSFASELSQMHAKLIYRRLEATGRTIGNRDLRMLDAIGSAIEKAAPSVMFFTPEMGLVYQSLMRNSVDSNSWQSTCTQLALATYMAGVLTDFDYCIDSRVPLYVSGLRIDPGHLRIKATESKLEFRNQNNGVLLSFAPSLAEEQPTVWLPGNHYGIRIPLGSSSQALLANQHLAWPLGGPRDHTVSPELIHASDQISSALNILEEASPEFYAWVVLLLRQITPIHRLGKHVIGSASNFYICGVSQVTVPATIGETIEMLVHECSHHFFNLAMRFGAMDKEDAPQYFSPLTKSNRPLNRILTGYHAFGNVQLVYNRLAQIDSSLVLSQRSETVARGMEELSALLETGAEFLTEMGRAFYLPMRDRLRAEQIGSLH